MKKVNLWFPMIPDKYGFNLSSHNNETILCAYAGNLSKFLNKSPDASDMLVECMSICAPLARAGLGLSYIGWCRFAGVPEPPKPLS